jgi:hypothetical protein
MYIFIYSNIYAIRAVQRMEPHTVQGKIWMRFGQQENETAKSVLRIWDLIVE